MRRIGCIYNDSYYHCKNKKIKRSFFGIGFRLCLEAKEKKCEFKKRKEQPYPNIPPRPPRPKQEPIVVRVIVQFLEGEHKKEDNCK